MYAVVSVLVDAVRMFEDNYPEILEELFVINGGKLMFALVRPLKS